MAEILNYVNENPWLNIVFIVLTLSSIFLSIWFYLKSRKSRKPTYAVRSFNLVKEKINKIDSVEILYQDNKIDNLSITKLAIWNGGKETISASDVAQNHPFEIKIDNGHQILDYEIVFVKNQANGFNLTKKDSTTLEISFDYFDFNEGMIVQLYHTATNDEAISVHGSFKGTKKIIRTSSSRTVFPDQFYRILEYDLIKSRLMKRIIGVVIFLVPLVAIVSSFLVPEAKEKTEPTLLKKILMTCLIALPYWWLSYRMLKRTVPKEFVIFEDEF